MSYKVPCLHAMKESTYVSSDVNPNWTVDLVEKSSRKLFLALFAIPFFAIGCIIAASFLDSINTAPIINGVLVAVLAQIIVIIAVLFATNQLARNKWNQALGLVNLKMANITKGVITGLSLMIALQVLSLVISLFTEPVESSQTSTSLGETAGMSRYIVLLFIVPVIVPFVEEVFFRGYIMGFIRNSGYLTPRKMTVIAVIISSIFFASLHVQGFATVTDWFVIGWITFVAVINAILVIRTGSVWTAVASHIAYNSITVLNIMS